MRSSVPALLLALSVFLPACNGSDSERLSAILELEGDVGSGGSLYASNCSSCHGSDAGGSSGPAIAGMAEDVIVEASLTGPMNMPSFSSLENQELADIAAFVSGL